MPRTGLYQFVKSFTSARKLIGCWKEDWGVHELGEVKLLVRFYWKIREKTAVLLPWVVVCKNGKRFDIKIINSCWWVSVEDFFGKKANILKKFENYQEFGWGSGLWSQLRGYLFLIHGLCSHGQYREGNRGKCEKITFSNQIFGFRSKKKKKKEVKWWAQNIFEFPLPK